MEPSIPTSFIPKRPVTNESYVTVRKSRTVGVLSLLAGIAVIGTALAFAGTYLYGKSLAGQEVKLQQQIDDARKGIGTDFVADMKRLTERISGVEALLQTHIVVTPIFQALQATTIHSVQYKTFSYEFLTDPGTQVQTVKVTLEGIAKSYSTIALQSDAFSQSTLIKNPVFSDLALDDKTNTVNFKLQFDVAPSDLSYEAFIDAKSPSQQSASVPSSTPATTPVTPPSP
ncbi:MAG TPA: hypothetical protein VG982_00745 [Candidatus Paceibacterota bacterium]|jgi:hypothetical protein|nr:hypothetical protein [Candidatus Paceibacterota bacterium]